jgi:NAD kinase
MQLRRRGRLHWHRPVQTVLLVKKWQDRRATDMMQEVSAWLLSRGVRVLVEANIKEAEYADSAVGAWSPHVHSSRADLAVVLGGDGTLLHLTKLYSNTPPPPVISFNMGARRARRYVCAWRGIES